MSCKARQCVSARSNLLLFWGWVFVVAVVAVVVVAVAIVVGGGVVVVVVHLILPAWSFPVGNWSSFPRTKPVATDTRSSAF